MKDLIDRQQAIDAVSRGCFELRGIFQYCKENIEALPSAHLDRKKGHWETGYTYPDGAYWKCSCCGELSKVVAMQMDYCGRCGAYMLGEKDG